MQKLSIADTMAALSRKGEDFSRLLEQPSFDVSLYKPTGIDPQKPHARDELYVIASGSGRFTCNGETENFAASDVFFVPAGVEHRFVDFSADFSTWVIFFGPRPAR
jgi:mannose-6-phosphate isomerase-like protein (cupin superfamily)